ncbi:response regulator transcription factor [Antrihabitans cavernicola]|uniref:Response regulator transcription factor n=1 Tax=Antrihabitans cavernicola TaxID=2495913 RepID=A0A5A7SH11_9NOCA|nr:response regulator transcription factor [Spelaeibacter cavernicola]KAA0024914.1 response regulator transcription factor [Spelaeibacter cavernicola]
MTASDNPTQRKLRAVIIDDHAVIHDGIQAWCDAAVPPISVADRYTDPHEFIRAFPIHDRIDVVVLDLQFEQHEPDLAALRTICEDGYRVIIYSQHTEPILVLNCLDMGAVTYLSKTEGRDHLVAALHAAITDRPYLSPTMAKAMTIDHAPSRPRLSHREREVLLNWFQTESKILVGQSLYITVGTVNTHLARIRTKYASVGRPAPTKAALVARAIQDGLIRPDEL